MAVCWNPDEEAAQAPRELERMAAVLEGRHGVLAGDVADFFAALNAQRGDSAGSWAWTAVGDRVRSRCKARMADR